LAENVFCDLHHGDLYYSMHLLFEERLKMNLYRPIGLEWFQRGFWKIAEPYGNAADTIDQFLGTPKATWDSAKEPTQRYGEVELRDDVYYIPAKIGSEQYIQKAITLDKFLKMDFGFIVASYLGHDQTYAELTEKYKPKAVYVRQIGNIAEIPHFCRNVMLAMNTPMPSGVTWMKYFPELHKDYCYAPPANHNVVKSFIAAPLAEPDLPLFYEYERSLSNYIFRMHGILGRDGVISGDLMPQVIKDAAFVWHVKHTGCAGFVGRQALACGRPCIIKKHYGIDARDLTPELFEDGVNCIDLDQGTTAQNIERIKQYSEPERHRRMCMATAEKFGRDVNYAADAERIKSWLSSLERR
jgi:hypothetical protein